MMLLKINYFVISVENTIYLKIDSSFNQYIYLIWTFINKYQQMSQTE